MKMLLEGLRAGGVGTHRHTLEDFYRYCDDYGIRVIWSRERFPFYFSVGQDPFIVLPLGGGGSWLLFAAWHECYHAMRSPGATALFGSNESCDESEADAFALIAIMPFPEDGPLDDSPTAYKLWRKRLKLWNDHAV